MILQVRFQSRPFPTHSASHHILDLNHACLPLPVAHSSSSKDWTGPERARKSRVSLIASNPRPRTRQAQDPLSKPCPSNSLVRAPLLPLPHPWTAVLTLSYCFTVSQSRRRRTTVVVSRSRSRANLIARRINHNRAMARTMPIRPDDSDRQDDRRVLALRIRARRPCHSPPLLRQQMGTRVRPFLSNVFSG